MEYKGTPVGTHIATGRVNEHGQYEYTQEFTLASLQNTSLVARHIHRFSLDPPYLLQQATFEKLHSSTATPYETLEVLRSNVGLRVQGSDLPLDRFLDDYSLEHYLGLEAWLSSEDLASGHKLSLSTIRAEDLSPVEQEWTVERVTPSRIHIRSSQGIRSEYDTTNSIPQLTFSQHPSGLSLRNVEKLPPTLTTTSAELSRHRIRVALEGELPRPTELSMLELDVKFTQGKPGPWSSLLSPAGTLIVSTTHNLELQETPHRFVSGQNSLSTTSRQVQELANSLTNGIHSADKKLAALVEFTHNYVRYKQSNSPQTLATTLDTKSGDCSDIAELLNALAIATGLPSRTVYGLAYDKTSRSFGIHAWNQIRLTDNQLRSVDPTWNQLHADATHIEFPDAYAHEVLASLEHMTLSVVRFEHFSSHI